MKPYSSLTPGSEEAVATGCTCPVVDNAANNSVDWGDGAIYFWTDSECPLHGEDTDVGESSES